ncbi:hypothetical protein QTP86_028904 [Hemibagrus guttatus]|nr:hypothetical protein QTP86_028904 [Hemibagrus guttatus]
MDYKEQVAEIEASAHFGDLIEFLYPIGYSHWGVYDGDGYVIHFAVADETQIMNTFRGYLQTMFPVCGDLLLGETRIRRQHLAEVNVPKGARILVNNSRHSFTPSEPEEMKRRRDSLLDKQLPYHLFNQNCEHFATFVRFGKAVCNQIPGKTKNKECEEATKVFADIVWRETSTSINFFSNLSNSSSSVGSDHTGQPSLPTCINTLIYRLLKAHFQHQRDPGLINDLQQSEAGGESRAPRVQNPVLISRKSHHPASPSSWRRVMTSQRLRHATRALPAPQSSSSRSSSSRSGPSTSQGVSQSAASSSRSHHTWPEEAVYDAYGLYSLHRMFDIVGTHLTHRDVRVLSFLSVDVIDEYERGGIRDGRDFLLALERQGRCDETNFRHILQLLRIITRHDLLPYVTLRKRQTVCPDPVDQYLEETSVRYIVPRGSRTESPQVTPHRCAGPHPVLHCPSPAACQPHPKPATPTPNRKRKRAHSVADCREKQTCDIRLRVRAEYCQHDSALQGNVFSNKQEAVERQFERFNQANTILKSRDLGSIICDIKFSELTYLDAFWRDYINGSLLEALKGVFITDSLKQAVGHEAIKLLVNVDEEDYQAGRRKLLRNLMMGGGAGTGLGSGPGSGPAGHGVGTS